MNETKIINLNKYGSSMGTRELGKKIYEETLSSISNSYVVLFDFTGIRVISSAFADELFGKLYIKLGEQTFKNNVKVNNFDDDESKKINLAIINKVIAFRKTKQTSKSDPQD